MSDYRQIYLDNAATTRVSPEVFEAMKPFFAEEYGNSSTLYRQGREAAKAVATAREQVAGLINANVPEIYFTSGGTESDNWAVKGLVCGERCGAGRKHVITSAIEHHAVLETVRFMERHMGCVATVLPVDEYGLVDPQTLRDSLRDDTALVSIMAANNEVGTVEPIRELAEIAHDRGALFHTDAVQAAGKIPLDVRELGVDLLSLSGHKFHAPKGIGALYVRKGVRLGSFMHGGMQENNRRAGTLNNHGIVGLGKAAELAKKSLGAETGRQRALVEDLWKKLSAAIPEIRRNGHPEKRVPNILSVCLEGVEGEAILLRLDMYGIMVSSGSACTTGSLDPSHVLLALGLPAEKAHGSVRFSLGQESAQEDIDKVAEVLPKVVSVLREMSPTWNG
jgi:cysteine desulfurase